MDRRQQGPCPAGGVSVTKTPGIWPPLVYFEEGYLRLDFLPNYFWLLDCAFLNASGPHGHRNLGVMNIKCTLKLCKKTLFHGNRLLFSSLCFSESFNKHLCFYNINKEALKLERVILTLVF